MRYLLIIKISHYKIRFVKKFTVPDENQVNKDVWQINEFPLLILNLQVNLTKTKKKDKKKKKDEATTPAAAAETEEEE